MEFLSNFNGLLLQATAGGPPALSFNWLALLAAAVVPMAVGFMWYNPKTVGGAWMKSIGKTEKELMDGFNPVLTYGIAFVLAFLLATFLFITITLTHGGNSNETFGHGMLHGAIIGFFTVIPTFVTNGMFERKKWSNTLINVTYWIITFALMGGVVDMWR